MASGAGRRARRVWLVGLATVSVVCAATLSVVPTGPAQAATPVLARYPYLTDLTSSSVDVVWATSSADTSPGVVTYGPAGSCNQSVAVAAKAATTYTAFGETTPYYQHSVQVKNLAPSTAYCYRVYSGTTTAGSALLDPVPRFPTTFTTMPAGGSSQPFSFDVLGDFGETSLTNNAPLGTYNQYQDALHSQLAASASDASSPALFAVSAGDVAYNSGTTTNYGDLSHPADGAAGSAETSNIFDARYWGKVGSSLPLFSVTGNHGRNNTFFSTWPTATNVAASAGTYTGATPYPAVDGLPGGNYPGDWYAFTVGGVRFYVLDSDWTDLSQSGYPALGGGCPLACPSYQADRDEHWQQTSAEYQWLANDLRQDQVARGASALRMAFFHYPLRVDQNNYTTQQDVYLQNSASNPTGGATSLEALLATSNVNLVFNGHAHLYERNVAPPGGVPSYVTGGGGAVPTNVAASSACSPTDAYARGWDPTHAVGSACGSPSDLGRSTAKPTAAAQVYHFLKVTVAGTTVSVNPTDSTGTVFDPATYQFAADSTAPSVPGAPTAVRGSGSSAANVTITRGTASTDNVGVVSYDVYRDGVYRATMPASVTRWTDVAVPVGIHVWTVAARDQRGNASPQGSPSAAVTVPDTTAPSAPGAPVAQASAAPPHTVALSWAASTDNVGVASYQVFRDGTLLASGLTTTSVSDTTANDVTSYTYTVQARDAAGNVSSPSSGTRFVTPDWTAPGAPTLTVAAGPPGEIDLSWSGATDNVAVAGYDIYRDGVRAATGRTDTTWSDTGLAAGSTHSYVVVARDAAGNSSPPSNTGSATVDSNTVPVGPPTGLSATQLAAPGHVDISWSAPTTGSASSYDLYRGSQLLQSGLTGTAFSDTTAPDSVPTAYKVVAFDTAGRSDSASVTLTPDWTAPTQPGGLSAVATSTTAATVSWSASTDTVGVTGYVVTRTDAGGYTSTIANLSASDPTSVTDTGRAAGATYRYGVTARDAAANVSPAATATVAMPVFVENFESGSLAAPTWTPPTAGLSTQLLTAHSGAWAAEEISSGAATWSAAQLPTTYRAVHASAWVYLKNRSTSAGFLKLRTANGAFIAYLYVNASGFLSVRNDAGNVTHVSSTPVSTGQWHKVEYYLDTNPGGPITITAALDGTNVTFTTPVSSTETLGSSPIGQVVLGDTVAGRTYDIAIDDLAVDTQAR
ncbi:MAG: fibronectin type III domain-containing protein [Actinomycetes bacterium]